MLRMSGRIACRRQLILLVQSMLVSRRHFFFGSFALPALAAKKTAAPKPNILLLMTDRLPAWMLGAYGNKEVRTPNLDRLAQTGTCFLNHFTCVPAPRPGAAALLTGRTPMQIGPDGNISAADVTIEKMLAGSGYACQSVAGMPYLETAPAALKFVDQQSAAKPFFLSVAFPGYEPPYASLPEKYLQLYANHRFENYSVEPSAPNAKAGRELLGDRVANWRKLAAGLTALDDQVQSILARLSEKKLIEQTLVIFTSTCGSLYGRHGLWDSGDASDPPSMYDEAVKTPMIWSWSGRVPAQATQVELVSSYDLLPTLCDVIDAGPPDRNLCGRSYKFMATGKRLPKKQSWRKSVFAEYQNTGMARIERYKLVWRNDGKGPNELYDLAIDPGERINQAANEQFLSLKTGLSGELEQWKKQYSR
jgi:arylsulfatase A-like enzyme